MGTKDIMLKNYFTPERFADMFNAIAFNGRRIVDPGNVTPWEKEMNGLMQPRSTKCLMRQRRHFLKRPE